MLFRRLQGARTLLEKQKEDLTRRLQAAEGSVEATRAREVEASEEHRNTLQELSVRTQENEILQQRYVRPTVMYNKQETGKGFEPPRR